MKKGKNNRLESIKEEFEPRHEKETDYVSDIKRSFYSLGIAIGSVAIIYGIYQGFQLLI